MANLIIWNCFNEEYSISRPVGPHVLAHWLRHHGYTAKVIDFCHALTEQELIDISMKHIEVDTIAIGASTTFWKPTEVSNRMHEKFYDRTLEDFYEPIWVIKAREAIESKFPSINWLLGGHAGVGRGAKQKRFSWTTFTSFAEDSLLNYMNEKSPAKVTPSLFDIKNLSPFRNPHDKAREENALFEKQAKSKELYAEKDLGVNIKIKKQKGRFEWRELGVNNKIEKKILTKEGLKITSQYPPIIDPNGYYLKKVFMQ